MTVRAGRIAIALLLCGAAANAPAAGRPVALELEQIDAEFDAARERCHDYAGQARNVCDAEARAARRIRKVELAARELGTTKGWYDAQIARAEAEFDVAKERCGTRAGAEREACVAEARAREAQAKDEARRARNAAEGQGGGSPRK